MIPPLVRRCPECGHTDWTHRFAVVAGEGPYRVACPSCGYEFEPLDRPTLN